MVFIPYLTNELLKRVMCCTWLLLLICVRCLYVRNHCMSIISIFIVNMMQCMICCIPPWREHCPLDSKIKVEALKIRIISECNDRPLHEVNLPCSELCPAALVRVIHKVVDRIWQTATWTRRPPNRASIRRLRFRWRVSHAISSPSAASLKSVSQPEPMASFVDQCSALTFTTGAAGEGGE